jgi:hypothetical protein
MDTGARPAFDRNRVATAAIVSVCLLLTLSMAACFLSVAGVYERVLPLPVFALHAGSIEFDTPCPSLGVSCDSHEPFFSMWRGDRQVDGSVTYHQLFFVWLKPQQSW